MIAEVSAGYFRVTEKTNPRLYHFCQLVLARLDMLNEYPLFCKLGYDYNTYITGVENPIVVIHFSTLANTGGEMLHLLGHELGRIKSGYLLYYPLAHQMNAVLVSFGGIAATDFDTVLGETMIMLGRSDKIPDISFLTDAVMKQIDTSDFVGMMLYAAFSAQSQPPVIHPSAEAAERLVLFWEI